MFQTVKHLLEKNKGTTIDEKINSIKGKFQAVLLKNASSTSVNSLTGADRERRYILTFTSNLSSPPPLPIIQPNPNLFKKTTTEYVTTAFTFYFEEIQEPFPNLNGQQSPQQDILPILNEGEPTEGLHSYDFNVQEFTIQRQNNSVLLDICPHFLRGFQEPIRTYPGTLPQHRALSLQELYSSTMSLANLSYICIQNVHLKGRTKRQLFRVLTQTHSLETLILKSMNLGSIQKAQLPKLRFVDLSNNKIRNLVNLRKLLKFSTKIEIMDLSGNPISMKDEELYLYKLSEKLPQLEVLNKKVISIDDRLKAASSGNHSRQSIEQIRWELHLDSLPEIRQLRPLEPGWRPQIIQQIQFNNVQIKFFYVGNLVNLQSLDLSNNQITEITNTGLEKCDNLKFLSLKNNLLVGGPNLSQISILSLMPSIQCVRLSGNLRLTDYRMKVIYLTKNSKGNNRTIGIIQVDETIVSRIEKIQSIEMFEPPHSVENESSGYLWKLLLIERYGHKQLQTIPDFLSYVKTLDLSRSNIVKCDLNVFHHLELLNLSGNKLRHLTGMNDLFNLRIINLQDNPELSTSHVVGQLANLEKLESIIFNVTSPTPLLVAHSRSNNNSEYRRAVLQSTLIKNRSLVLLDNTMISFDERVQAYIDSGFPLEVVEKYRYFLALNVNCTLPFNRGLYPDQVEIGKQYDPLAITSLLRLRNWGLTSPAINLSFFVNVQEIDLSNNRITDILSLGLESLQKINKLSLMNNQISTPILLVAQLLDQIPSLEIITLRGNPNMLSPEHRLQLIGHMASMKTLDHNLKVIDTEVSIYDKVEGWKLVGGSIPEAELFKLSYICSVREDLNIYDAMIQNLELSDCALEFLDLTNLVNLRTLLLPNNRFKSLQNIKSLHDLSDLFALDLRYNQFDQMLDISNGISQLGSLRVLGINGNPFPKHHSASVTYRIQFLSLIPGLFKQHLHPLSILDSQEISPEEIVESSLLVSHPPVSDKKEYLFHISMLRKAPSVPFEMLTELDLSNCKISILVLRSLTKLVVLSLSDNLISDSNLRDSGISYLYDLKALDIRNNHLKDLSNLCKIIDLLNIESLFVEENHCFDKDNQKTRVKFFKKCSNSAVISTMKYLNGNLVTSSDTEKFTSKKK